MKINILNRDFIKKFWLEGVNIFSVSLFFGYLSAIVYYYSNTGLFISPRIQDVILISIMNSFIISSTFGIIFIWSFLEFKKKISIKNFGWKSNCFTFILYRILLTMMIISFITMFYILLGNSYKEFTFLPFYILLISCILFFISTYIISKKHIIKIKKRKKNSSLIFFIYFIIFSFLLFSPIFFKKTSFLNKKDIIIPITSIERVSTGNTLTGAIIYLGTDKVWIKTRDNKVGEYFLTDEIKKEINKRNLKKN